MLLYTTERPQVAAWTHQQPKRLSRQVKRTKETRNGNPMAPASSLASTLQGAEGPQSRCCVVTSCVCALAGLSSPKQWSLPVLLFTSGQSRDPIRMAYQGLWGEDVLEVCVNSGVFVHGLAAWRGWKRVVCWDAVCGCACDQGLFLDGLETGSIADALRYYELMRMLTVWARLLQRAILPGLPQPTADLLLWEMCMSSRRGHKSWRSAGTEGVGRGEGGHCLRGPRSEDLTVTLSPLPPCPGCRLCSARSSL